MTKFIEIPRYAGRVYGLLVNRHVPGGRTVGTIRTAVDAYARELAVPTSASRVAAILDGVDAAHPMTPDVVGAVANPLYRDGLLPHQTLTVGQFARQMAMRFGLSGTRRKAPVVEDEAEWIPGMGDTIPGYTLGNPLGEGSMATVFRGHRDGDHVDVAVKVFNDRKGRGPRLLDGALTEIRFQTGEIEGEGVPVIDFGRTTWGYPYLTMPLMSGGSLRDLLMTPTYSALPERHVERVALRMLATAARLHRRLLIHRDLKPENVLLTDTGPTAELRLCDYGLGVKMVEAAPRGMLTGSVEYLAPEGLDLRGVDTQAGDVYALGVILHEIFTGYRPSRVRGEHVVRIVAEDFAPSVRRRGWPSAIAAALEPDPTRRYPDANVMLQAVQRGLRVPTR